MLRVKSALHTETMITGVDRFLALVALNRASGSSDLLRGRTERIEPDACSPVTGVGIGSMRLCIVLVLRKWAHP